MDNPPFFRRGSFLGQGERVKEKNVHFQLAMLVLLVRTVVLTQTWYITNNMVNYQARASLLTAPKSDNIVNIGLVAR